MTAAATPITYNLHGCFLTVVCRSSATARAAEGMLGCFPVAGDAGALARLDAEDAADLRDVSLPWAADRTGATPRLDAEVLRREHDYAVYRLPEEIVLVFRLGAVVRLRTHVTTAAVTFAPRGREHPDFRPHVLFFAISELLKRHEFHTIHACAVERDGHALLIAGRSGSGKTTAGLALVRAGWRLLSDDHPLVRRSGEGFDVLPFPRPVGITPRTAALLPELSGRGEPAADGEKRSFAVETVYPGGRSSRGRLAGILAPRIVDTARSVLEPLPRSRALEALLPQALVALEPDRSRREFELWADVARSIPAYLLHFGADVTDLPHHLQAAGLVD